MRRPLAALKCSRRERNLQHRRTNQPTNEPPFAPSLPCFMIYSLSLSLSLALDPRSRRLETGSNGLEWVSVRPSVRPMYNYTTSDYPTTLSSSFSMQTHARPDRTLAPTIVLSSFYSHFFILCIPSSAANCSTCNDNHLHVQDISIAVSFDS